MSPLDKGPNHVSTKPTLSLNAPPSVASPGNNSETSFKFHVEPPLTGGDSSSRGDDRPTARSDAAPENIANKGSDVESSKQSAQGKVTGSETGPAVPLHKRLLNRAKTKSLRLKRRDSEGSRASITSSTRSQKRNDPKAGQFSQDMSVWQASDTDASDNDSFVAVNPYEKPKRSKRGTIGGGNQIGRAPHVETSAWTTPVEFSPAFPVSSGTFNGNPERPSSVISHGPASITPSRHSMTSDNHDPRNRRGEYSVAFPPSDVSHGRSQNHPHVKYEVTEPVGAKRPMYGTDAAQFPGSDDLPWPNTTSSPTQQGDDYSFIGWWRYLSKQAYLYILLGLPSLYFTRVVGIFDEANIGIAVMKRMVLDNASTKKPGNVIDPYGNNPAYSKLQHTWEHFIDALCREWKTLNVISVLLLSAILGLIQIDSANTDPLVHYAALYALVSALVSLLLGCIYIVRFNTMRKPHKAIAWAQETQKELEDVGILWNVWILLALPAVWLVWSIIIYVMCIVAYVWRGDPLNPPEPFDERTTLAARCIVSSGLGLAVIYGVIVMKTFIDFGAPMDKRFKRQVEAWQQHKKKTLDDQRASFSSLKPQFDSTNVFPRHSHDNYVYSEESDAGEGDRPPVYPQNSSTNPPGRVSLDGNSKAGVRFLGVPPKPANPHHANVVVRPKHPLPLTSSPPFAPNKFDLDAQYRSDHSDSDASAVGNMRVRDYGYPTLVGGSTQSEVNEARHPIAPVSIQTTIPTVATLGSPTSTLRPLKLVSSLQHADQPTDQFTPKHRRNHTYDSASDMKSAGAGIASRGTIEKIANNSSVVDLSNPTYSSFSNFSPHQIQHHNLEYLTAAHLFEAMKYMKHHLELAERIRNCPDIDAMHEMSRQYIHSVRSDWNILATWKMEKVLYLKFTQHPELRTLLLNTHPMPVVCDGPSTGITRNNFCGALSRVRERLLLDRAPEA